MPRQTRAVDQRRTLGRRIRAHRLALGLASRDIAAHIGTSHSQMTSIETTCQDVLTGTLIEVAEAVGLNVALAADYHLPLLDLTADEIRMLLDAAREWDDEYGGDPDLAAALAKLAPPVETYPSRPHADEPHLDRPVTTVHLPATDIAA